MINFDISPGTCSDGVLNQNETAIDCGGTCAGQSSCANGLSCNTASDCKSSVCNLNICQGEYLLFIQYQESSILFQFRHVPMVLKIKMNYRQTVAEHVEEVELALMVIRVVLHQIVSVMYVPVTSVKVSPIVRTNRKKRFLLFQLVHVRIMS